MFAGIHSPAPNPVCWAPVDVPVLGSSCDPTGQHAGTVPGNSPHAIQVHPEAACTDPGTRTPPTVSRSPRHIPSTPRPRPGGRACSGGTSKRRRAERRRGPGRTRGAPEVPGGTVTRKCSGRAARVALNREAGPGRHGLPHRAALAAEPRHRPLLAGPGGAEARAGESAARAPRTLARRGPGSPRAPPTTLLFRPLTQHFRGRKNRCYRLAVRAVMRAFVKCTKARRLKKRNLRTVGGAPGHSRQAHPSSRPRSRTGPAGVLVYPPGRPALPAHLGEGPPRPCTGREPAHPPRRLVPLLRTPRGQTPPPPSRLLRRAPRLGTPPDVPSRSRELDPEGLGHSAAPPRPLTRSLHLRVLAQYRRSVWHAWAPRPGSLLPAELGVRLSPGFRRRTVNFVSSSWRKCYTPHC